jgi:hypothetical protein
VAPYRSTARTVFGSFIVIFNEVAEDCFTYATFAFHALV